MPSPLTRPLALAVLLALLASSPLASHAADTPPSPATPNAPVYYRLVLENAMFSGADPKDAREIVLDLEQVGDNWGAVYGVARNYNQAFHRGAVKDAKIYPDQITLRIGIDATPDKWIPGGQGDYTVTLSKDKNNRLTGTYAGKYRDTKITGKASGFVYAPAIAKDHVPLQPQEHPRLLFRKSDLPALKEKFATPFGQAAKSRLERSGTPSALGLLYQLTGDQNYAKRAEKEAEEYLSGRKPGGDPFVPKKPLWAQLEELALVYDLCYDALSDDFKARYRAWVADLAFQVYFAPEALGNTNWVVVSNHVANVYSGVTLSALNLYDEPSPPPAEPSAPFLDEVLPAAKDFTPPEGVPVVALTPGKSPTEWIHTEPLRRATPDDPREVFYGLEKINPKPGTTIKVGDFALTFDKMPPENKSDAPHGGLKVGHLIEADAKAKAKEPFTMVLYTVLDVKEPGQYVVQNPVSRANLAQVAINGRLLANGQVVRLEKGLYPMTQMVQWRMKWGEIAPTLRPATEADVKNWETLAAQLKQKYQTRLDAHATVLDKWKHTGGGDPAFARMLRLARFTSAAHCEMAVGRGGFQAEVAGYSMDASSGHAQLWPVYRRVMGFDLSPNNEYPDFIPRKLIGGPQDINGTNALNGEYFAALFPTLRKEWQPEVLTAWHNQMKVTNPEKPEAVLNADPVRSFLYYPLDMKPAPLGTHLPLVWEAPDFGYYVFRSGWDKDAFVAQVFLKSQHISGWNGENAGTYRLRGLGQDWATGTTDRVRKRQHENVVWIPEGDLADGARGHLTHFQTKDKTMTLSVNLDEVYDREGRFWSSKYANIRFPHIDRENNPVPPPSGVTGMRALGFDYSGQSGAPCLFVVVDKINGGGQLTRRWLFQPPVAAGPGKNAERPITASEKGFTIAPPEANASLQGTFAYPPTVDVSTDPLKYSYIKNFGKAQGTKIDVTINALTVPGIDHFYFVGTIAPKGTPHPELKVEGKGLDAKVTVGKRTVTFDGEKVIFGTP